MSIAITIGETEANSTCVSLMSEFQNCLLPSSMSKTDENVNRVNELGFETEEYIFLNLLMSGNSVWVSPKHFDR